MADDIVLAAAAKHLKATLGISDEALALIWSRVKANSAKLETCRRHRFTKISAHAATRRNKYRCENCGGEADSDSVYWYEMGLGHGSV
jgi:hypothetical protein